MSLLKRSIDIRTISRCIRCYSNGCKTHYEVLDLPRNCTEKEIKEAFIKMSKKYHPDKNKDVQAQEKFIRIAEAYEVLSKPSSRANYDSIQHAYYNNSTNEYSQENFKSTNYQYNYTYETRQNEQSSNTDYNSFKRVKKLPHTSLLLICIGIGVVGVLLQYLVISHWYSTGRRHYVGVSQKLSRDLDKLQESAQKNTNELQTQMLLQKIVTSANQSATSSLGQALANEKKNVTDCLYTEFDVTPSQDCCFTIDKSMLLTLYDIVKKII